MSLHGKFRVLLAVFGLSIFANVLISVWCIHIYVAEATQRFQVLLVRTRDTQDTRRLLEELTTELRDRCERPARIHDLRYRRLAESIAARLAERNPPRGEDHGQARPRPSNRLAALADDLIIAVERCVDLLGRGQREAAQTLLTDEIIAEIVDPLHRLLADDARSTDQVLTRTSADIDRTQTKVTWILGINAAGAFLLAAIGVHLLRHWVLRPVDALKHAVEIHARGELQFRVPVTSNDELGTLAQAVNRSAEALWESQQRLVEQQRLAAIGEVAASVAHNIRNPLASLRAAAQAALPDFPANDRNRARLEEMIGTVDSLNRWLRELLMVSRPIALTREAVSVASIVARVLAVMQPAACRRNITLIAETDDSLHVHVDVPRIEQALLAVVDNAVEASPPDAAVRVNARADDNLQWIDLTVHDAGPGIAPDVAEQIAKPHFSTKPGGAGIGLHLARRIVQAHGGALSFHNTPTGGTMVTLRLAASEESEETVETDPTDERG